MKDAGTLAQLRDIHLPEPVSWWPPAPGWWLLAAVLLAGLVIAGRALRPWLRRLRRHRYVARSLDALLGAYRRDGDPAALAAGVSRLLRRQALAEWPRHEVAGLTGETWLEFLDRTGGDGAFREGPGRGLAGAAFGAREAVDGEALVAAARRWSRRARGGAAR